MVSVAGSSGTFVAAGGAQINRSADSGATWSLDTTTANYPLAAVASSGNDFAVVGTRGSLLGSVNGGVTFTAPPQGLNDLWSDSSVAVGVGDGGRIVRRASLGQAWVAMTSGTADTLTSVAGGSSSLVAVGQNGAVVRSGNNGATWSTSTSAVGVLKQVVWCSGASFAALGQSGGLFFSGNGGVSWAAADLGGTTGTALSIVSNGARVSALFDNGALDGGSNPVNVMVSTDSGQHFTTRDIKSAGAKEALSDAAHTIVVAGTSAVSVSTDDGATFTKVSSVADDFKAIYQSGQTVVVVGQASILYSSDGGASFTGTSGSGAVVGGWGQDIYADGSSGFIESHDGGTTWSSLPATSVSPVPVGGSLSTGSSASRVVRGYTPSEIFAVPATGGVIELAP